MTNIVKVVLFALSFYITGRLGLLLAVPPGYATAVWPPSGVALAGVLLLGYRYWPGVFFGSVAVNLFLSFNPTNPSTILLSLAIAVAIASGSSLQAVVAAYFIRRTNSFPSTLDRPRDVLLLMLLGGPVSCLIAATIGNLAIFCAKGFIWGDLAFSWFNWWVGDTIGVIVFTPALLLLADTKHNMRRKISVAAPLLLTFTLVVVTFVAASKWETEQAKKLFERRASKQCLDIQKSLEVYIEKLHSLKLIVETSGGVERKWFYTVCEEIRDRYPGIQALSWVPRISQDERGFFEKQAQLSDYHDFQITERKSQGVMQRAGQHQEYFPVFYIEPIMGNELALGFDLSSDPIRRKALYKARDTGQRVATDGIILVQEQQKKYSFLVFEPVYQQDHIATVEERRKKLRGVCSAVFHIKDILQPIVTRFQKEQSIRVQLSEDSSVGSQVLYDSSPGKKDPVHQQTWKGDLVVADQLWHAHFSYNLQKSSGVNWHIWAVLTGGLVFTSLLSAFFIVLSGYTAHIEKIVEQKTSALHDAIQELQRSNEELDDFAHIAAHDLKEPLRGINHSLRFFMEDYQEILTKQMHEELNDVIVLTKKMTKLIVDLHEASRLGRQELAIDKTDIQSIIANIAEMSKTFFREHNAIVTVATSLPIVVCDEVRITEVFRNLITNGIKYNNSSKKQIEIGFHQSLGEERSVFYVKDNGIGIKSEFHNDIFRIFKRLNKSKKYGGGTGVGLTFVKKIIERHNGKIWLKSEQGQGTTFFFTIGEVGVIE